jgi:pimeloyl-ACP methyl ester carboxylesterase
MHREGEVVLPELLRRHGVVKPVVLGHSDGASIALIYAGSRADGPRGLILEAPHVFVEDRTVRSIEQAKSVFETGDWRTKLGAITRTPKPPFGVGAISGSIRVSTPATSNRTWNRYAVPYS